MLAGRREDPNPTRSRAVKISDALIRTRLNRNFEYVLLDFKTLERFGFRQELLTAFEVKVEELRAWANSELLEMQHERELRDWAQFGRRNRNGRDATKTRMTFCLRPHAKTSPVVRMRLPPARD